MIWLVGILVYTLVSLVYTISIVENQYHKHRWYDGPISLPAVAIAWIMYPLEKYFGVEE